MNRISRRRFPTVAAMGVAASRLRAQAVAHVTLSISLEATGPHIQEDYVGSSEGKVRRDSAARVGLQVTVE